MMYYLRKYLNSIKNILHKIIKVYIYRNFNDRYFVLKYFLIKILHKDFLLISSHLPYSKYKKPRLNNINWGDDVSLILPHLISKRTIIPTEFYKSNDKINYACIGSVLSFSWVIKSNTIVWGSGVISMNDSLPQKPFKVLAVRGPLSRMYLLKNGVECPEVYGDPVLLFPNYYKPNVDVKYKIGFIPHHKDIEDKNVVNLINKYCNSGDNILIDPVNYGKWSDFIDKVCQCEFIISSSLHGIIIADAYKIPNSWCEFSYKHPEFGFKFNDYYLSVNKDLCKPFKFDKFIDMENLFSLKKNWIEPTINLKPLIECCPFK